MRTTMPLLSPKTHRPALNNMYILPTTLVFNTGPGVPCVYAGGFFSPQIFCCNS
uniref:Uncharacterized protein n=1 Tax=Anguilla anguilla TaxID=7936 RepID=A0A0E9UIC9_ANGAN